MSIHFSRLFRTAGEHIGAILTVAIVALMLLTLVDTANSDWLPAGFGQAQSGEYLHGLFGNAISRPPNTAIAIDTIWA